MGALPTKYDSQWKGKKEKLVITIQYCGGWGGRVFYQEAKKFLYTQEFGRYVKVKGIRDFGTTENFEIRVIHPWKTTESNHGHVHGHAHVHGDDGDKETILVHSKKRRYKKGDWLLRTKKERENLVAKIDAIMCDQQPESANKGYGADGNAIAAAKTKTSI